MHIGVVADPDSFHTEKWCYGLQRMGVNVSLFSFSSSVLPGIKCIQVPAPWMRKGRLTYGSFIFGGKALRKAIKAHKPDILNPINVTPYGVWAACAQAGIPIVSVAMGADILEYPPDYQKAIPANRRWDQNEPPGLLQKFTSRLKWQFFRYCVRRALEASALTIGDNLQLTDAVRDWFGIKESRTMLHRWGIEEALFQPDAALIDRLRDRFQLEKGQPVLLSIRGLKPVYQADIILAGLEAYLEEHPDTWRVLLLGAGYEPARALDQKARELEARFSAFKYVPERLSRAETHQLWHLADAFINVPVYDGFSNGLNEGRFVGAVPILNDIDAHREIAEAGRHARFVHSLTPVNLAQELTRLYVDLPKVKPIIAKENRIWTLENAHFETEMKRFLQRIAQQILTPDS